MSFPAKASDGLTTRRLLVPSVIPSMPLAASANARVRVKARRRSGETLRRALGRGAGKGRQRMRMHLTRKGWRRTSRTKGETPRNRPLTPK